jgi:hypothetical protein
VESFHQFKTVDQFADSARLLADLAKDELLKLRERFPTIQASAAYLRAKRTEGIWDNFHAGVSSGLVGDVATAKKRLGAIATEKDDYPWVQSIWRC